MSASLDGNSKFLFFTVRSTRWPFAPRQVSSAWIAIVMIARRRSSAKVTAPFPAFASTACQSGLASHFERRSEEHTSELQSLMRISYAVFCLKQKKNHYPTNESINNQ